MQPLLARGGAGAGGVANRQEGAVGGGGERQGAVVPSMLLSSLVLHSRIQVLPCSQTLTRQLTLQSLHDAGSEDIC